MSEPATQPISTTPIFDELRAELARQEERPPTQPPPATPEATDA